MKCLCVLTDPLVVLLFLDLLHLVQQLSHSQLQLSQLVLRCDFRVVIGVFSHLNVQMDSLERQETSVVSVTGQAAVLDTSRPQLQIVFKAEFISYSSRADVL